VPFRESWPDDLSLLAALGATSVTLTLEWAALEPQPGAHDRHEIDLRRQVLQGAIDRGLAPWVCLVDRTLPGWFADDEGGFDDDRARGLLWPRHIDWVGETFGDLVAGWIPQREPLLQALRRFWLGTAPPGRRDGLQAAKAVRDAMLADGEAWRLLRGTAPVATHQTARLVVPDPDEPGARAQAGAVERLLWHPWLSALAEGRLRVGDLPERTVDHLRDAFDQVVVQLRSPIRVDAAGRWLHHPRDRQPGPGGLVAWPDAIDEALARAVSETDGRPVVAAADLADVADDGRARPDHLQYLLGLPDQHGLAGLWLSSPIDGYHFASGFDLQPGILTRDRAETEAANTFRAAIGGHRPPPT
jgi:beta-glucosidase